MKTLKKLGILGVLVLSIFALSNFNIEDAYENSINKSSLETNEVASIDWTNYDYSTNSDLNLLYDTKCGDDKKKTDTTKTAKKKVEHKCGDGKCGEGKCGDKMKKEEKEKKEKKEKK